MEMKILISFIAVMGLAACSSLKEKVGLAYYSPNEFETVQNEPLEVPSTLQLENPEEGPYKRRVTATEKAQSLLLPSSKAPPRVAQNHQAEQVLLEKIGSDKRDMNIRRVLDRDRTKEPTLQEKIQRTLVFWKKPTKGKVIDPHAEKNQLDSEEVEEK